MGTSTSAQLCRGREGGRGRKKREMGHVFSPLSRFASPCLKASRPFWRQWSKVHVWGSSCQAWAGPSEVVTRERMGLRGGGGWVRQLQKQKKGKRSACPKFKAWYSLRVIPTLLDSVVCKWHRNQQSERLSFSVRLTGHDRSWKGWGYISQLCWCQHEQSEFDIPE